MNIIIYYWHYFGVIGIILDYVSNIHQQKRNIQYHNMNWYDVRQSVWLCWTTENTFAFILDDQDVRQWSSFGNASGWTARELKCPLRSTDSNWSVRVTKSGNARRTERLISDPESSTFALMLWMQEKACAQVRRLPDGIVDTSITNKNSIAK